MPSTEQVAIGVDREVQIAFNRSRLAAGAVGSGLLLLAELVGVIVALHRLPGRTMDHPGEIAVCAAMMGVGYLFFGWGMAWATRSLLRGEPALRIGPDGIDDASSMAPAGQLGWDQVRSATVRTLWTELVVIELVDPGAFLATQPWWRQWILRARQADSGSPVVINVANLETTAEELVAAIGERGRG